MTKNGKASLVVIDCEAYEGQQRHERYVQKLREAEIEEKYRSESLTKQADRRFHRAPFRTLGHLNARPPLPSSRCIRFRIDSDLSRRGAESPRNQPAKSTIQSSNQSIAPRNARRAWPSLRRRTFSAKGTDVNLSAPTAFSILSTARTLSYGESYTLAKISMTLRSSTSMINRTQSDD